MEKAPLESCLELVNALSKKTEAQPFLTTRQEEAIFYRVIPPHHPNSISSVKEAILAGTLPNSAAVITELRGIFLVALRYYYGHTIPERQYAVKCLNFVDDFVMKHAAVKGEYESITGYTWVIPEKAFSGARACRAALESFLKDENLGAFFYAAEVYFEPGTFYPDYYEKIRYPTSLSDVSEKLYDCQPKAGGTTVGAAGPYTAAEQFRDHACLVFDNVITYYPGKADDLVETARNLRQKFIMAYDKQMGMAALGRKVAGAGGGEGRGGEGRTSLETSSLLTAPPHSSPPPAPATKLKLFKSQPPSSDILPQAVVAEERMTDYVKQRCLKMIETLKTTTATSKVNGVTYRPAEWFTDAVPREHFPDYYDIITKPMWLNEIVRKLENNEYRNEYEMKEDLDLIVTNCYTYNDDAIAGADSRAGADAFATTYKKLFKKLEDTVRAQAQPIPKKSSKKSGESLDRSIGATAAHSVHFPAPAPAAPAPPEQRAAEPQLATSGLKLRLKAKSQVQGQSDVASSGVTFPDPHTPARSGLSILDPAYPSHDGRLSLADLTASPAQGAGIRSPAVPVAPPSEVTAVTVPRKINMKSSAAAIHDSADPMAAQLAALYPQFPYRNTPEFRRMLAPKSLRDMRLVPLGWPSNWLEAERVETAEARSIREQFINMTHNIIRKIKSHPWRLFFSNRWVDSSDHYLRYPEALRQQHGLNGVFEKLRAQIPRQQGSTTKGKVTAPPRPNDLRSESDVYMSVQDIVDDVDLIFDTAIQIHSDGTWQGDPLDGAEVVQRAKHLRAFFDNSVVEMFADSLPSLAEPREKMRHELIENINDKVITDASHEILKKLMRRLTGKKRTIPGIEYFALPPDRIWKDLPKDYYEKIKYPMDLLTLDHKLGEDRAHCVYRKHSEFLADLRRISENAILYNGTSTTPASLQIVQAARLFASELDVLWVDTTFEVWDAMERHTIDGSLDQRKHEAIRRRGEAFRLRMEEQEKLIRAQRTREAAESAIIRFQEVIAAGSHLPLDLAPEGCQLLATAANEDPDAQAMLLQQEIERISREIDCFPAAAARTSSMIEAAIADITDDFLKLCRQSDPAAPKAVSWSATATTAEASAQDRSNGVKRARPHWETADCTAEVPVFEPVTVQLTQLPSSSMPHVTWANTPLESSSHSKLNVMVPLPGKKRIKAAELLAWD